MEDFKCDRSGASKGGVFARDGSRLSSLTPEWLRLRALSGDTVDAGEPKPPGRGPIGGDGPILVLDITPAFPPGGGSKLRPNTFQSISVDCKADDEEELVSLPFAPFGFNLVNLVLPSTPPGLEGILQSLLLDCVEDRSVKPMGWSQRRPC